MSWQRIHGHEGLVQAFAEVVAVGRLAHAYLFTGPAGVGKRLFAGELAKTLLCEARRPEQFEACDRCASCLLVAAGTHPDFFTVARPEEGTEFPIEIVRELCRAFSLKPARGSRKIAIVDDADDLSDPAANCFLKTLEEPPPGSLLILIAGGAERQLATIVSRCQVIHFAPLTTAQVAGLLRDDGLEDEAHIDRLARLSEGSPGQARALADPALWNFRRTLLEGLLKPRIDSVGLARLWMDFLQEAGKESAVQRRRAVLTLRLLIDFVHDALRLRVGGTTRLGDPEEIRLLQELGKRADPDKLLDIIERCLEGDVHLDRRVQLVLAIEALVDALGQHLQPSAR